MEERLEGGGGGGEKVNIFTFILPNISIFLSNHLNSEGLGQDSLENKG